MNHKANISLDEVILVDEQDREIGYMDKMQAHISGALHRAFSVFLFNTKGEMLLQQRADHKYHSAGLWSNSCCSHPKPGENILEAGKRRLQEEIGVDTEIKQAFSFIYKVNFENGLIEYELDHVLVGHYEGIPSLNLDEVKNCKWASVDWLQKDIIANPQEYTEWFKICLQKVIVHHANA